MQLSNSISSCTHFIWTHQTCLPFVAPHSQNHLHFYVATLFLQASQPLLHASTCQMLPKCVCHGCRRCVCRWVCNVCAKDVCVDVCAMCTNTNSRMHPEMSCELPTLMAIVKPSKILPENSQSCQLS